MTDALWTNVWRAMQDLGAALGAIDDLPDWAAQLAAAIDETQAPAEEAALEECHD